MKLGNVTLDTPATCNGGLPPIPATDEYSASHYPTTSVEKGDRRYSCGPSHGLVVKPSRDMGVWVASGAVGVTMFWIVWLFATNPNMDWPTVWKYMFAELTLRGLWVTLYLTLISMTIGLAGGTLLAVMALTKNPLLKTVAFTYVTVFRGIPVLVQILFWGFLGAFIPLVTIGLPFTNVVFLEFTTSGLISATTAAILALGLNEVAYASEIVRAGITSVSSGQREAARALGMRRGVIMKRIILPQAMRVIVPPMGNEVISVLKTTALVSVIAGNDLMTNIQHVYAQNYRVIPMLVVASIWYLIITLVFSYIQLKLERRFGKGFYTSSNTSLSAVARAGR